MRAWFASTARLTALVTCVGLATSRLGLLAHELVGHGGAALAVGGEVTRVHLFWLAGGWVRYQLPAGGGGGMLVALGGILVESIVGLALWLALARGPQTFARRIVRAVGAALVLHASWYLATGTWHGYGDGLRLHRALGEGRYAVAIGAGMVTVGAAYLGARLVVGQFAATIPGRKRAWIAGTALALTVGGALQLGGALGEVALREDNAYGQIMRPERERIVDRELAVWAEAHRGEIDAAQRARMQAALAAKHRTFPFAAVLAVLAVLSAIAGARGTTRDEMTQLETRLLALAGAAAAGSIAVVIAIDRAFA